MTPSHATFESTAVMKTKALNRYQIQRELDEIKISSKIAYRMTKYAVLSHKKTIDSVVARLEKLERLVKKSSGSSMASKMLRVDPYSTKKNLRIMKKLPVMGIDSMFSQTYFSLKRRKVEHLETVDEKPFEEASSSKSECEHHPGSFGNLCLVCGQLLEETGVSFSYKSQLDELVAKLREERAVLEAKYPKLYQPLYAKGLMLNKDEISRLSVSDVKSLQPQRKMHLVLDLDHTLLNTTKLSDLKPEEEYLKSCTHPFQDVSGGSLFEDMHMMTKLRPYVRSFLKEANEMFEMYIYTLGDRRYAKKMANLLDPKREYFGNRIISRDDGPVKHLKSLDMVHEKKSAILILDDRETVWPNHKDNLIVIQRYHFFASSCRQFGLKSKSQSQLKSDESEPDGALATMLKVLKQVHALYFEKVEGKSNRDVRSILKRVIPRPVRLQATRSGRSTPQKV